MSVDVLRQRVATTTCARCRKDFEPGDRVEIAYIVQKVSRNPTMRDLGAYLGEEFELTHVDCRNPSLDGRIILT